MPPEPVTGFCILPRVADDGEDRGAHRVAVAAVRALELAERRGVEVEPLDADPHLVGPQLAAGVEPLGRLGQHAAVVQDPVQPGRIAGAHDSFSSVTRGSAKRGQDSPARALDTPSDPPPTVAQ